MNLMEMVDLNNVMRSYYWRDEYDSRGTYKYWNVRTQRAFFGLDVRVQKYIGPDRLVKYYKPEMHSVMAEALCDEFLMTYDKDEDDFVPIDDFTEVLTARASERSSDQKYFEKVRVQEVKTLHQPHFTVKWGASSLWSFGPNTAWGSIRF